MVDGPFGRNIILDIPDRRIVIPGRENVDELSGNYSLWRILQLEEFRLGSTRISASVYPTFEIISPC